MIRLAIVDDQVILRESLKFIIEQDNELEVVGFAGNGEEALKLCDELKPDIILMDIMMPVCDGVEGTRLIKEKHASTKVLVLTTFDDSENIAKALKNGADGYILKDIKPDELILAIKSTAKGFSIIHKNAMDAVVGNMGEIKAAESPVKNNTDFGLSEREIEVISLIVDGKSNKDIAEELHFTEGSIKNIITVILSKLQLKDRTQLAVFAVKNRLV